MPPKTKAKPLTALKIKSLVEAGYHPDGEVTGLYLSVSTTGSKSWILRKKIGVKRRDVGLGGFPTVTLAEARDKARSMHQLVSNGIDPVAQRNTRREALRLATLKDITFQQCARLFFDSPKAATWKNAKHASQWRNTLETYVYPVMGNVSVRDVTREHVLEVLQPIWLIKHETATRVRQRIESVLSFAIENGYYVGLNPARLQDNLENTLASSKRVRSKVHHKAMHRDDVGAFVQRLNAKTSISAYALHFLILTAARSGEVRGATWDEVDVDHALWIIPRERMKAGKEHRVPLSKQAIAILKKVPRIVGCAFVFPSAKNSALSDMTLNKMMRDMEAHAVPHGFRSTFKDWASETTDYPNHMTEMALAHTIPNDVEAAYRRGDMVEKRRRMMQHWADFCSTKQTEKVLPIKASRAK
jgi:integrase